jgi:hypothetical protein
MGSWCVVVSKTAILWTRTALGFIHMISLCTVTGSGQTGGRKREDGDGPGERLPNGTAAAGLMSASDIIELQFTRSLLTAPYPLTYPGTGSKP